MANIKELIYQFIEQNFLIDKTCFDPSFALSETDSLLEKGVVDSTGVIELVEFLEKEFKISISNEEVNIQNLDSISAMVNFVERKFYG